MIRAKISDGKLVFSLATFSFGLYLAQFFSILKYSVNIPFWDEWESINRGAFLLEPSLRTIFSQHNEHRIVTTKLVTLALYYVDGWDLTTHQALNFIVYGCLVVLVALFIKRNSPQLPTSTLLCFTIFLLSWVSIDNHFWAFQLQFHLALIFLFLSVWFLFGRAQSWVSALAGSCCAVLAAYSFSAGLVGSVVILGAYAIFKLLKAQDADGGPSALQFSVAALIIGSMVGVYFIGYTSPPEALPLTLPTKKLFWTYFLNLLSGGFGYKIDNIALGIIVFFFALIPVAGLIKRRERLSKEQWALIVATAVIFAALVTISMGRAGNGKGNSKQSRYSEIAIMLLPLGLGLWSSFLAVGNRWRNLVLGVFWIYCFVGLMGYWNFPAAYRAYGMERQRGRDCVADYYQHGGDANCPEIYPRPIADRLEIIRNVPLSFLQEMPK